MTTTMIPSTTMTPPYTTTVEPTTTLAPLVITVNVSNVTNEGTISYITYENGGGDNLTYASGINFPIGPNSSGVFQFTSNTENIVLQMSVIGSNNYSVVTESGSFAENQFFSGGAILTIPNPSEPYNDGIPTTEKNIDIIFGYHLIR